MLRFSTLCPEDVLAIQAQPSQQVLFGMPALTSWDDACAMAEAPVAWSARAACDNRLVACFGIVEHFPGVHGLAWSVLADGLGVVHLQLTRFMRSQVEECGLARLELLAKGPDLEAMLASFPYPLDSGQIVELAMRRATRAMRWAVLLGMKPAHLLRCHGAACESYMLFERINPPTSVFAASNEVEKAEADEPMIEGLV